MRILSILILSFISFGNLYCLTDSELKAKVAAKLPAIHGWCSAEKSDAMIDLILNTKPKVCVEIGVFAGSSILPTASALKCLGRGKVYAIDPWKTNECLRGMKESAHLEWWSNVNLNDIYLLFIKLLREEKISEYCKVLKMSSKEAVDFVPKTIDILHIDGNHCEEAALFDAQTYIPKVKPGGYIWFDDIDVVNGFHKGTIKGFQYALKHATLVKYVDNGGCALLRKN